MGFRALLVHVRIFKLKVLFPYFTCSFGRVGPSFDHDGTIHYANRDVHATTRNKVKHRIYVKLDNGSNEAIRTIVSSILVEK